MKTPKSKTFSSTTIASRPNSKTKSKILSKDSSSSSLLKSNALSNNKTDRSYKKTLIKPWFFEIFVMLSFLVNFRLWQPFFTWSTFFESGYIKIENAKNFASFVIPKMVDCVFNWKKLKKLKINITKYLSSTIKLFSLFKYSSISNFERVIFWKEVFNLLNHLFVC